MFRRYTIVQGFEISDMFGGSLVLKFLEGS